MGCLLRGFVKLHKNTKPHRCRSRQVFTGCFVITKTKRTQYYRATEHALGTLTASFITPTALLMVQTVKATTSPPSGRYCSSALRRPSSVRSPRSSSSRSATCASTQRSYCRGDRRRCFATHLPPARTTVSGYGASSKDLAFLADEEGLLILSEEDRFPATSAPAFSPASPQVLFRANGVLSTISNRQFKSGKYYKATDETTKLFQHRTSSGPVPGVLRRSDLGLADNPSRFFKHTSFQEVKFSPAMASTAAGIAAQAAIEAAIAEIKEYLEVIDEKLDTLLRQRKVDALAQLGGIQYTIEEADELYRHSSSVSATTWSKVDHLGSALNGIESYAIEQLDDTVDQLRKQKNNSKKLETFLAGLKGDLPLWLGVAARSIYLHDRMYVLEIAHVNEFEPRQLDSHREGIHDARKDRLESTTRRLLEMDTAIRETAKLSNQVWVTNPIRARHITAHANEIHDIISAFAQHLRMSVEDAESLHVQGWRQSVVSLAGDTIDAANRARQSAVSQAQKATEKIRDMNDDRLLAKAAEIEARRERGEQKALESTGDEDQSATETRTTRRGLRFRRDEKKA